MAKSAKSKKPETLAKGPEGGEVPKVRGKGVSQRYTPETAPKKPAK